MPLRVAKKEFLAAVTCRTQGWYLQHATDQAPGLGLQWRFWVGAHVHDRARAWLGDGVMLRRTPLEAATEDTQQYVADASQQLLFETTFVWNGLVARADAIRRHGIEWDLIEIKSGKFKSDEKVNAEFVDDLAYTRMVAAGAGLKVARALLILINGEYRLNGTAEPFAYVDLTEQVNVRAAEFSAIADDVYAKVSADERPAPEMIFACKDCDWFKTDCVGRGIPDPLFVIPRITEKKFEALKHYERVSRLPADADLTDTQRKVVEVIQSGTPRVNSGGLAVLDNVQWPVRYLDFEAISAPFPWFEETEPYQMVPFQYSLHQQDAPGAPVTHKEYLAPGEGDWRLYMTEQLLYDLGTSGSIVVYSSFEKQQLNGLAKLFPELADQINAVIARLFDLEVIFKHGYQHPGFLGRTSIKKVLPVMVPALSYNALVVNNGDDALGVFGLMRVKALEEESVPARREQLLRYCELDTLAMVRLHEATAKLRGGG
ncbi:MAG: DUF2779 domain-containing protein [Gemmatimonadetes bacterium]|nr:DUF2779 domain-containing protein [Gemmatimonadota bacterium]